MRANLFWFSDGQWARIEPFIPSNRRGVKPKNNRRILSGIMHVLKSGCRWVDCPPEYGPAKTVYNRFNRWSAQGIWQSIFEAAAEPAEPPERMALDSTHVKAHRCAGGGKGGRRNRRLASPRAGATARFTALSISCAARGSRSSRLATPPTAQSGRHVSVCSTASPSCSVTRLMTATRSASLCARTASNR